MLIIKFNEIPIKIQTELLQELDKMILNYTWSTK